MITDYNRSQKPERQPPAPKTSFFARRSVWAAGVTALILIALAGVYLVAHHNPSPVPADIRSQVSFKIFYPAGGYVIDPTTWKYLPGTKTLNFVAKEGNSSVVFTEQETPLAFANDQAAYQRFIGGLKPSATFDSPQGSVSITGFVTAGDFQNVGRTAILNAQGTLVLAHPSGNFSDDQWRSLFQSLNVGN